MVSENVLSISHDSLPVCKARGSFPGCPGFGVPNRNSSIETAVDPERVDLARVYSAQERHRRGTLRIDWPSIELSRDPSCGSVARIQLADGQYLIDNGFRYPAAASPGFTRSRSSFEGLK